MEILLVLKLELWPKGNPNKKKTLGTMFITNDGTGTDSKGNYKYKILGQNEKSLECGEGRIEGYRRKSLHSWYLPYTVLQQFVQLRLLRRGENNG